MTPLSSPLSHIWWWFFSFLFVFSLNPCFISIPVGVWTIGIAIGVDKFPVINWPHDHFLRTCVWMEEGNTRSLCLSTGKCTLVFLLAAQVKRYCVWASPRKARTILTELHDVRPSRKRYRKGQFYVCFFFFLGKSCNMLLSELRRRDRPLSLFTWILVIPPKAEIYPNSNGN